MREEASHGASKELTGWGAEQQEADAFQGKVTAAADRRVPVKTLSTDKLGEPEKASQKRWQLVV